MLRSRDGSDHAFANRLMSAWTALDWAAPIASIKSGLSVTEHTWLIRWLTRGYISLDLSTARIPPPNKAY